MTEAMPSYRPRGAGMCWIKVDERVLQRNLLDAGQQMTREEINEWLHGEGWQLGNDGLWLVDALSLELLDPCEYRIVEPEGQMSMANDPTGEESTDQAGSGTGVANSRTQ